MPEPFLRVDRRRRELGYAVRRVVGPVTGAPEGWLTFDRPFTLPWRAWCAVLACKEIGGAQTRAAAALLVDRHWVENHAERRP